MRPRIVEALDATFGTSLFDALIPTPATVYALAMLATVILLWRRSSDSGLKLYHVLGVAFWVMLSANIGARVFHLAHHWEETIANPAEIIRLGGATASWGAYLGGALGLVLYCWRYRESCGRHADLIASAAGLSIAIGRWSCFLNGDDYGTLTNLPWAVRFPHGSYTFAAQARANFISPLDELSLPVHPVQLYLSLNGLVLLLLATWFWRRYREVPGATFCAFWLTYSVSRFALEVFRGDHDHMVLGFLSVGQAMCLVTAAAAAFGLRATLCSQRPQLRPRSQSSAPPVGCSPSGSSSL